jgi:hypothetical protein
MSNTTPAERPIDSWADYRDAVLEVLESAGTFFVLFDSDFSTTGLESPRGIDSLVALARRTSRIGAIRLLVRNPTRIESDCPRLLRTLADFSHCLSIKALAPGQNSPDTAFAIADDRNLVLRFHFERPQGRLDLAAGTATAEPLDQFDTLWENAAGGPAIRTLGL